MLKIWFTVMVLETVDNDKKSIIKNAKSDVS